MAIDIGKGAVVPLARHGLGVEHLQHSAALMYRQNTIFTQKIGCELPKA